MLALTHVALYRCGLGAGAKYRQSGCSVLGVQHHGEVTTRAQMDLMVCKCAALAQGCCRAEIGQEKKRY